ncbi:MAG: hypothetical protein AAF135_26480 [Bacteroidota bacterium]
MGIYRKEIAQLRQSLAVLEQSQHTLKVVIDQATDPELLKIYHQEMRALIDQIDEVNQAIEILQHREDGAKNGFDELAEQTDWTNPENWPNIRSHFGFEDNNPHSLN